MKTTTTVALVLRMEYLCIALILLLTWGCQGKDKQGGEDIPAEYLLAEAWSVELDKFIDAIIQNDTATVKLGLDKQNVVLPVGKKSKWTNITSLGLAVEHGSLDVMHVLLMNKAKVEFLPENRDLKIQPSEIIQPLIVAADRGDMKIIDILFRAGVHTNYESILPGGHPVYGYLVRPMDVAVLSGNEELIAYLQKKGGKRRMDREELNKDEAEKACRDYSSYFTSKIPASVLETMDTPTQELFKLLNDFDTPLTLSYLRNYIEAGADINHIIEKPYEEEVSSLHFAIFRGDKEAIKLLLEKGADASRVSVHIVAILKGDVDIYKLLVKQTGAVPGGRNGAFYRAISQKRWDIVDFMLTQPLDFSDDYKTLDYLLEHGTTHWLDKLQKKGLDLNMYTPYITAYQADRWDMIYYLLDQKVDLNSKEGTEYEYTFLNYLMNDYHLDKVRFFIAKGADPDLVYYSYAFKGRNQEQVIEKNIFTDAIEADYTELVYYMIEHGADINIRLNNQYKEGFYTPLEVAIHRGNLELVQYLINAGADVLTLQPGKNLVEYARRYSRDKDVIQYLEKRLYHDIPLYLDDIHFPLNHGPGIYSSARELSSYGIESELEKGIDPSMPDTYGNTPLHYLTFNRPIMIDLYGTDDEEEGEEEFIRESFQVQVMELIELLARYKADMNAQNNEGKTPLFVAVEYGMGDYHIVRTFLENGADINIKDSIGRTVLFPAIERFPESALGTFLEMNTDVNVATYFEKVTPLHVAASHFEPYPLYCLVEAGANLKAKTFRGDTPADIARLNKQWSNYQYLCCLQDIKPYENMNEPVAGGSLPIIESVKKGDIKTIQKLIEYGADINLPDPATGEYPLFKAISYNSGKSFMELNPDVNVRDKEGRNALLYVMRNGRGSKELVQMILEKTEGEDKATLALKELLFSEWHVPYATNVKEIAQILIDAGADVNYPDPHQPMLLMKAKALAKQHSKYKDVVQCLLDAGAKDYEW